MLDARQMVSDFRGHLNWLMICVALWGAASLICKYSDLDEVGIAGAAVVTGLTAPARGKSLDAGKLRLEDFPKAEEQVFQETLAAEKLSYRFALTHGWRLRDRGLSVDGTPLLAPEPYADIDESGGNKAHR